MKYSSYILIFYLLQIFSYDDETDEAASMPVNYAEMDIDTIMNGKVWHKNHSSTYDNNYKYHACIGRLSWASGIEIITV